MRCSTVRKRLEAYLDGELAPTEMQEARAHLDDCPVCRQVLEERRAFGAVVREHLDVSAPPELKAAILDEAENATLADDQAIPERARAPFVGESFWQRFLAGWSRRRVVPVLAGATALLALVIVQRIVLDGSGTRLAGEATAFSRPGRVIVFRYGEAPAGEPASGTEEAMLFGGLVLDDPR